MDLSKISSVILMLTEQELKTFVQNNNLIGYASAVIFALTLKDLIASFIGDILVPGINLFLIGLNMKRLNKYLPGKEKIDVQPFVKSLFTFLVTFFLVFLGITVGFNSWTKK
jgi:large-conductance mechanosensitive channel